MKFSEFYQSVIGARPEAKVPGMIVKGDHLVGEDDGASVGVFGDYGYGASFTEEVARAICLRHWLTLLPKYHGVHRVENIGTTYEVWTRYGEADWGTHPTPEEAVGEYLKANPANRGG